MKDVCFEHGEGWSEIINEMCEQIQYIFTKENNTYGFCILQEKEKYGQLRIYFSFLETPPDVVQKLISNIIYLTEQKSLKICEYCGNYGKIRTDSYIHVSCDNCEEKLY